MMSLLAAVSVGLLAAPVFAQPASDKIVRLDRPFTDQETGRVYDCRYAVGEEARVRCHELAYKQEQYGFTVFGATVVNERVTRPAVRDPWFDRQRSEVSRRLQERRRRELQRRQWEQRVARDRNVGEIEQPSRGNYPRVERRAAPVSNAAKERRAQAGRNSKERRERRRPGGGSQDVGR